jgi:hypothetical protein
LTEIARMRFKSVARPKEHGTLTLHDDGTLQIKPSPELQEEMSRLEEVAHDRSQRIGYGTGAVLIGLGLLSIAAGWYLGRKLGNLGGRLREPRPVDDIDIERDPAGGIHLRLRGLEQKFQMVQMGWNADEILQDEAAEFVGKFNEMKRVSS